MRALVVDDSKPSRSILARVLRDLRFDCTEATNGLEALAALSSMSRPDLVTINWHMPVMDGIALIRRLRALPDHRGLKLLMVSTENDKDLVAAALAAGADDYLAKPFTPEALARKLVALGVCTAAEAAAAGTRGPIRVLVVDDSATIRSVLSATLGADPDLRVVGTAINGQVAIASIAASPPDIVLLDVEMPVLDGISTLREIRRMHPKLPVLMFSSLTDRGSKATLDALLAGANDYVAKPTAQTADEVAARIRDDVIVKIKTLVPRGGPAARVWGGGTLGIVLTGMGRDGLQGSRQIVEAGGTVIAQDEFTSVVWGMPGEVVRAGLADAILPLSQIGVEVAMRLKRRGV